MSTATSMALMNEPTLQTANLDTGQIKAIQEGLASFARFSGAVDAALLDPTGAVLLRWEGSNRAADLDALGVLCTASFTATKALAQRLGDRTFGGICHQGRGHCLYVAPLVQDFMLLTLHAPTARVQDMRQSLIRIVPRLNQQLVNAPVPQPGA